MRCAPIVLGALLFTGHAFANDSTASAVQACIDRVAPQAVQSAVKADEALALYGYHTDIYNSVRVSCGVTEADFTRIAKAVDAEIAALLAIKGAEEARAAEIRDAQNADLERSEVAEETQGARLYFSCLVKHAKTLALVSTETADLVASAVFPSCPAERADLHRIAEKYHQLPADDFVAAIEARWQRPLLLEVIKARAARAAPSTPSRRKPKPKAI